MSDCIHAGVRVVRGHPSRQRAEPVHVVNEPNMLRKSMEPTPMRGVVIGDLRGNAGRRPPSARHVRCTRNLKQARLQLVAGNIEAILVLAINRTPPRQLLDCICDGRCMPVPDGSAFEGGHDPWEVPSQSARDVDAMPCLPESPASRAGNLLASHVLDPRISHSSSPVSHGHFGDGCLRPCGRHQGPRLNGMEPTEMALQDTKEPNRIAGIKRSRIDCQQGRK